MKTAASGHHPNAMAAPAAPAAATPAAVKTSGDTRRATAMSMIGVNLPVNHGFNAYKPVMRVRCEVDLAARRAVTSVVMAAPFLPNPTGRAPPGGGACDKYMEVHGLPIPSPWCRVWQKSKDEVIAFSAGIGGRIAANSPARFNEGLHRSVGPDGHRGQPETLSGHRLGP
ncbi:hypothetical protein [Mycobacterium scrofulaceum]|uniref:hypothetical protein n=1 Tax=Mycobacterium scrofulaceum TaxID=1783 RepID=UPI001E4D08BE|nr:hypothetical protein [Mycobacterium scrofulaceum]